MRGGHLYRDHTLREEDDEAMDAGWLAGKRHPITNEPLVRERLALPPGSLVAALTHAPHYVDRRRSGVRYGALLVYANPDPQRRLPRNLVRRFQSELSEEARKGDGAGVAVLVDHRPSPPALARALCARRVSMQLLRAQFIRTITSGAVCGACGLWLASSHVPAVAAAASSLDGIISYSQLWVGADGETHVAHGLSFGGLQKTGYSGTPQYVRQFEPADSFGEGLRRVLLTSAATGPLWLLVESALHVPASYDTSLAHYSSSLFGLAATMALVRTVR